MRYNLAMFCLRNGFCFLVLFLIFVLVVGIWYAIKTFRIELSAVNDCVMKTRFGICTCEVEQNILEQLQKNIAPTPATSSKK